MDAKTYLNWVGKTPAPWYPSVKYKLKVHRVAGFKWLVLDENRNGALAVFSNLKPQASNFDSKAVKKCKQYMTVFEAELLYCAFLRRKQRDYARFDKCVAGQQFFADLEALYVIKPKIVEEKITERVL